MTTQALKASDPMPLPALRYLDFAVLALALPVFLVAGLPLFAWAGTTAVWLLQRAVQSLLARRAEAATNPGAAVGLMSVSLLGRLWLLLLAVLAIGLIDRDSGLPAAVLTAVTFQAWLTGFVLDRSLRKGPEG